MSLKRKILANKQGVSIMEVVFTLTVISVMVALVSPSFFGFQKSSERKVHLMTAVKCQQAVQAGVVDGWVQVPLPSNVVSVTLDQLIDNDQFSDILDPSTASASNYLGASFIQLYNNSGKLEYYIQLKALDGHTYVDKTSVEAGAGSEEITAMSADDILLAQ